MERSWTPLGNIDITADQTAIDGLTAGYRFTDYTEGRAEFIRTISPGKCTVQVGFYGEALWDTTSSFGCEIWAGDGRVCQQVCDVTGLSGAGIADFTNADNTDRVMYDDLTVGEWTLWEDVTARNLLSDGLGYVEFTSRGMTDFFLRAYNIGDTTEVKRLRAMMRTW